MSDAPKQTQPTAWKPGDRIDFDNGGSVIVHWVDGEWVGFSTDLNGRWADPILRRMTPEDFEASLQITREQIARGVTHDR